MNWEHVSVIATATGVIVTVLGWIIRMLSTMRHNDLMHVDEKLVALTSKMDSVHEDVKDVRTGLAAHIGWHMEHPDHK